MQSPPRRTTKDLCLHMVDESDDSIYHAGRRVNRLTLKIFVNRITSALHGRSDGVVRTRDLLLPRLVVGVADVDELT